MLSNPVVVHRLAGKLEVRWLPDARAIADVWTTYGVTLAEFRDAVLVRGLGYAKQHGGVAWIVDSSKASGVFSDEIQKFIGSDVFPAFSRAGIKYFVTISSSSALTNMSISAYKAKTGPNGLKLLDAASIDRAVAWLTQQRAA